MNCVWRPGEKPTLSLDQPPQASQGKATPRHAYLVHSQVKSSEDLVQANDIDRHLARLRKGQVTEHDRRVERERVHVFAASAVDLRARAREGRGRFLSVNFYREERGWRESEREAHQSAAAQLGTLRLRLRGSLCARMSQTRSKISSASI